MVSFLSHNTTNESKLADLLIHIARGIGLDEIAYKLGISKEELKTMIGALIAEGYIREARSDESCPCNTCPLKKICGGRISISSRTKVYVLTQKGIRVLAKLVKKTSVNV